MWIYKHMRANSNIKPNIFSPYRQTSNSLALHNYRQRPNGSLSLQTSTDETTWPATTRRRRLTTCFSPHAYICTPQLCANAGASWAPRFLPSFLIPLFRMALNEAEKDISKLSNSSVSEEVVQETTAASELKTESVASDRDASVVDKRALLMRMDLRFIPWPSFLYFLCFLDRASIGNARVSKC